MIISVSKFEPILIQVVAPINRMLDTVPFTMHCYSMDWHPSNHVSFIDTVQMRSFASDSIVTWKQSLLKTKKLSSQMQSPAACKTYDVVVFEGPPRTEQILWPRHCVQESWGSELHKDLKVLNNYASI